MAKPSIDVHEVAEGLWVGPYPGSPEFVQTLGGQLGVTGLVSLQTDEDLRFLGLSWPVMWKHVMAAGIAAERVPIEDFSEAALADGLQRAVEAVGAMRNAGRVTYLHCTAGLNRSPTVAIGYLIAHEGLSLDEAWAQVHARRPVMPLRRPLELWLGRRQLR